MKGLLGMLGQFRKIQADLEAALKELAESEFSGEAGAGAVKVVLSGKKELLSVKIDPSAVDGRKVDVLGGLVVAAASDAFKQVETKRKQRLETVVEGLPIPPGLLNI